MPRCVLPNNASSLIFSRKALQLVGHYDHEYIYTRQQRDCIVYRIRKLKHYEYEFVEKFKTNPAMKPRD
jgi:hypothetical protein